LILPTLTRTRQEPCIKHAHTWLQNCVPGSGMVRAGGAHLAGVRRRVSLV
jgi:hypothetical protein